MNEEKINNENNGIENNVAAGLAEEEQLEELETKQNDALANAQLERDEYKDRYLRTYSDFNNYKKRSLKSCAEAFKDGQYDIIEKMLPVLDSMDCAFEQIDKETADKALLTGFELVCRQMRDAIERIGVNEIPALGEEFNPELHQAIQMVEPEQGSVPGSIASVIQKGYSMGERIIRHSMVTVNK